MKSCRYNLTKQCRIKAPLAFILISTLLAAVVFTACGAEITTTSLPGTTTASITSSSTQATVTEETYSKYTVFTTLDEEFTITIGASFDDYDWEVEYEITTFEQIGESIFDDTQQAEINPFNKIGGETFTFKALKTGKTQILLVHRPVTDQGSLDYAEMGLWQEIFTIIVE